MNWGKAPVRAELVRGTVHFSGLMNARAVTVRAMDTAGAPTGEEVAAKHSAEGKVWSITLGEAPAIWYTIDVRH